VGWSVTGAQRDLFPLCDRPRSRGHLLLSDYTTHAYLVEVTGERRIAFILSWQGGTLVGTTEVRQTLGDPIRCDDREKNYLSALYLHYLPNSPLQIVGTFAGLQPLISLEVDPSHATREYVLHLEGKLFTIFGGKWTTSRALATYVVQKIE